jgi:oligoribonuclease
MTTMIEPLSDRLVWIDLEMTGLNTASDSILEIATVVTDAQLNEIAQGPVFAIRHTEAQLLAMDDWNREHHSASGLWQRVLASPSSMQQAEQLTLDFLATCSVAGTSPCVATASARIVGSWHGLPGLEPGFTTATWTSARSKSCSGVGRR